MTIEAPEGWIAWVQTNTTGVEGGAVRESNVTVGAQNEQRMTGGGGVELSQCRIATALVLVQSIADEPIARRKLCAYRFDARQQRGSGLDVRWAQLVPACNPCGSTVGVAVGVDDAGNRGVALKLHYLCVLTTQPVNLIVRISGDHDTGPHRNGFDHAELLVHQVYVSIAQNLVCLQHVWRSGLFVGHIIGTGVQ